MWDLEAKESLVDVNKVVLHRSLQAPLLANQKNLPLALPIAFSPFKSGTLMASGTVTTSLKN